MTPLNFYVLLIFGVSPARTQPNQQHSSISDRFYHRQSPDGLRSSNPQPDVWSSGVRGTSTFFQNVCRCSKIYRNRQLVNIQPFEIAYTQSEQDCVVRCATTNSDLNVQCVSLNYCNYDKRCELFQTAIDQPGYSGPGKCIPVNGCSYYSINAACLAQFTSAPPQSTSPTTISTTSTIVPFSPFVPVSSTTSTPFASQASIGFTDTTQSTAGISQKSCPNGQSAVYARAQGFADPRINIPSRQIQNIDSSPSCQSQCDSTADCQSFDYNSNSRLCNLYNSVNKDPLQPETGVDHFDVVCVPASANCHGTIDRVPGKVQFSSPTTQTASSVNDCINKCLSNQPCLAVSYFSNTVFNKDNCILSQQSRQTDPSNFIDEKKSKVDYYGLDACTTPSTSTSGGSAKSKLLRRPEVQSKKAQRPQFVQFDNVSPSTAVPNAKQFRQMLIDAQKQKMNTQKVRIRVA